MQALFSFSRFWKFLKLDIWYFLHKYWVLLLLASLSGLLCYLGIHLISYMTEGRWGEGLTAKQNREAFGMLCMIFSLCAGLSYGRLTDKRSGSAYVLFPASVLEKYLSMLSISLLLVPFGMVFTYGMIDLFLSCVEPTHAAFSWLAMKTLRYWYYMTVSSLLVSVIVRELKIVTICAIWFGLPIVFISFLMRIRLVEPPRQNNLIESFSQLSSVLQLLVPVATIIMAIFLWVRLKKYNF